MEILLMGLLLWSVTHLLPSLAPAIKRKWIIKLGENGYKGLFSVLIVFSIVLIVMGWRNVEPSHLYSLPASVRLLALLLLFMAFVLFSAANLATRIKRFIRHPQLTCIILWSIAHLLVNGDSRSIVLFGWMGIWAVVEIIFINRRDGEWIKEVVPPLAAEFKLLLISAVVFFVVVFMHPYIAGVALR